MCLLSLRIHLFINFRRFSVVISSRISFLHAFYSFLLLRGERGRGGDVRICAFFPSCKVQGLRASVYFPQGSALTRSRLCAFSQAPRVEPAVNICVLSVGVCVGSLGSPHTVCGGSRAWSWSPGGQIGQLVGVAAGEEFCGVLGQASWWV